MNIQQLNLEEKYYQKEPIVEILDENIAAAAFELANLQGFINSSEDELELAKFDLREIEEKEAGMMNFSREVESSRKLYETFLQRVKETNEAQNLQVSNVKIIESALLPLKPISPNILKITLLFYLISFGLIFFILVYFEFNSNTVVEPSHLESLDIPILATLPSVKNIGKGYHLSQIFLEDIDSEFSESIRT